MEGACGTQQRSCLIKSRDQLSKLLPDVLVELVEAYYPCDRDRASPIAPLMRELRFNRTPDHAHPCLLCIMCERPMFRLMGREPWESWATYMPLRIKGDIETREATKARLQNEIEQDRIAKSLEPVVAEHLMQKLPKELEDKIHWWATEPTPTAKIMKDVSIEFRVFPHSDYSPFGPGKKCVTHAELWKRGAFFRDPNLPDFVRRCEKTFKIHDIPLDAEPTNTWRYYP